MTPHEQAVRDYYTANFYDGMTDGNSKGMDWALLTQAGGVEGKTVLDLGCSYPLDALRWAKASKTYTLLDFCESVLTQAQQCLAGQDITVETCLADMRQIPLPEGSMDVVLSYSSLDHVPEAHERAHVEAYRVLKPGGRYVITVPNFETLHVRERSGPDHCGYYRTWTPDELKAELEAVGFVVHGFERRDEVHRMGYWAEKPGTDADGMAAVSADASDQLGLDESADVPAEREALGDDSRRERPSRRAGHLSR